MKTVFLNGEFVAESAASVPVSDRGFLYGDGLFETLRVYGGHPAFWDEHWDRLQQGASFLRIQLPFSSTELRQFAAQLIQSNNAADSVLRINLSRGVGARGYSSHGANQPCLVMTVHPLSTENKGGGIKLATASIRLPASDPLARFKTSNKLHQVIARTQAEEQGSDDALLLNTDGFVAETTTCNLFLIRDGRVLTPPVETGILPGVTRAVVIDLCRSARIGCEERQIAPEELVGAEGVFLTSSVCEIRAVQELDGKKLNQSALPARLLQLYQCRIEENRAFAGETGK